MESSVLRLVGDSRRIMVGAGEEDGVLSFYSGLIPRLLGDAGTHEERIRLVGYRARLSDELWWQFLGRAAAETDTTPAGRTVLTLGEDFGEVLGADGARDRFAVAWRWRDGTGSGLAGEFDAVYPADMPEVRTFSMTANAYLSGAVREADMIALADYDASWPEQFAVMSDWLRATFPEVAGRVVHYGSTSVPGMPAKPVIDILVEPSSYEAARRAMLPALNRPEWEYWWYTDHMIFIHRDAATGERLHHVHIAPAGHRLWEGVAFRDYLIAHPEAAQEYAALKRELAERFRADREGYTEAKTAFIRGITDRALAGGD